MGVDNGTKCTRKFRSTYPLLSSSTYNLTFCPQLFGASAVTKEYVLGVSDYSKATWGQNFIASIAGAVASITVAAPLDVVKTRIQNANFEQKVPGMTVVKELLKNEGPSAFFKGLTPKVCWPAFLQMSRESNLGAANRFSLWDRNWCSVTHWLSRLYPCFPSMFEGQLLGQGTTFRSPLCFLGYDLRRAALDDYAHLYTAHLHNITCNPTHHSNGADFSRIYICEPISSANGFVVVYPPFMFMLCLHADLAPMSSWFSYKQTFGCKNMNTFLLITQEFFTKY